MKQTVRAKVKNGRLEPLEKIDLPEGEEVTLRIVETPTAEGIELALRCAGAWKGIVECERFLRDIYRSRRRVSRRAVPRL
jgi:predicted DNA-binding antitoxin AbrB/MazE fold protein